MPPATIARASDGIQIQAAALRSTAIPRADRNDRIPIGDTSMGRNGKKYRAFENGEKNATPRPPLVAASRNPWESAARKIPNNTRFLSAGAAAGKTISAGTPGGAAGKGSE